MAGTVPAPVSPPTTHPTWADGVRTSWSAARTAVLAYLAVRAVGLLTLAYYARHAHVSLLSVLTRSDGQWYLRLVAHGYDTSIAADARVPSNLAFFPLYPGLIRAVSSVGVPPAWAGVGLAALFGVVAAWGIYLIGATTAGHRVGVLLAVAWGALPHGSVENMAYSETLFTALAAWALWAVLRRHWVLAAVLTALAGLTRATAAALVVAVGVAAVVAIVRRQDGWRPWVAAGLAPVGLLGYLAWVGFALGRWDAYVRLQSGAWGNRTDFGRTTLHELVAVAGHEQRLAVYVTTAVLIVSVLCAVLLATDRRVELALIAFAVAMLVITVMQGGGYYHSKARYLLPAFPLLLPVAMGLDRARPLARWVVVGALTAFSAWYGAYLAFQWNYSP